MEGQKINYGEVSQGAKSLRQDAEPQFTPYVGTKLVKAKWMSKVEFERIYKGIDPPPGGVDMPGYVVIYDDGYTSWCPQAVFERCYRGITLQEILNISS